MKPHPRLRTVVLVCCCCACVALTAGGKDYQSAHRVEPGDVISAEIINEMFDEIEGFRKTLTEEDLLGSWHGAAYGLFPGGTGQWVAGPSANYYALTNVVMTFAKEAADRYRLVTSSPNPFDIGSSAAVNTLFSVREGMIFGFAHGTLPRIIDRISRTRIRLMVTTAMSGMIENPGPAYLIVLDKDNVPPEAPHLLSAVVSKGKDVTLEWEDRSDDETGFVILRRDSLSGGYTNVLGVASNEVAGVDRVPAAGAYWYRVSATNSSGASLGSNVRRVVVP